MDWKERVLYPVLGPLLKAALWPLGRLRLPQVNGSLVMPALEAPVEILRDKWGVAHIYAQNIQDVVFAQGFVHAQERLWQMDLIRRVVSGRVADVLGSAALPTDQGMRTLSLYKTAQQEARLVSGELAGLLESYCLGVNTWIELACAKHKLPLEFMLLGYEPEPWQVSDSLGWGKMMCWTLAVNWQSELYRSQLVRRLGANRAGELEIDIDRAWAVILDLGQAISGGRSADATRLYSGPHAGEGVGSNNWVVAGSRSATGMPLLANDMHLELTTPGLWYENHLAAGEFEVTGVTMPGVPMVIAGHNRQVAWGFTDGCPDTQDLYEEHVRHPEGVGWEYEFKGEWLPVDVRMEVIKVKGGPDVEHEVLTTRHGPLINYLFKDAFPDSPPLALRWTALDPGRSFEAFLDMDRARDCLEFRQALRNFDDPAQNVVYADTRGNIAYSLNGRVPLRAKGDGSVPAPGWTGEYEWSGYIPFEGMPHLFNPPGGLIATANNQIQRPVYPYFLGRDYLVSDRAGRILELLGAREKIDLAYIQEMHSDQLSLSARAFARVVAGLQITDPELVEVVRRMAAWDGRLAADDPLACVYQLAIRHALRILLEHHLGEFGTRLQGAGPFAGQWPEHAWEWFVRLLEQPESPWFNLGNGECRDDVLKRALLLAIKDLKAKFGLRLQDWKWGRLHRLTFNHVLGKQKPLDHLFSIGPFPIGGDGTTIWSSYSSWNDLKPRPVVGPPFRFIADLGDLEHCWGVLVPGQSGNPFSRHFKDGVKPWFAGQYHPMLFRRDEVEQALEARLVLAPRRA